MGPGLNGTLMRRFAGSLVRWFARVADNLSHAIASGGSFSLVVAGRSDGLKTDGDAVNTMAAYESVMNLRPSAFSKERFLDARFVAWHW